MLDRTPFNAPDGRPFEKWGEAAIAGWQALPDVLLKNQHKLDLTATELLVLINLLSFWWYANELPFPRSSTIAKRMNVTPRTVQRSIQKLIDKKLLTRKKDIGKGEDEREVLDPEGLVRELRKFAVDDPSFEKRQHRMGVGHEASAIF